MGEGSAEIAGCMSAAGLILILAVCLSMYGSTSFQRKNIVGVKTLSGRSIVPDELFSSNGWSEFTSGWVVGGLSGVMYCYLCTQFFPCINNFFGLKSYSDNLLYIIKSEEDIK